jgi:hypothetical protein
MPENNILTPISTFFRKLRQRWVSFLDIREDNYTYRIVTLLISVLLAAFAVVLGLSLLGAVFGIKALNPVLGSFFSHSYGILAFFIPYYLGYAASVLADPRWRPDRVFFLAASPFPFLTLGTGYILTRDFDALSREYAFLDFTGKTGFGVIVVVITFLEVVASQMLKNTLFPKVIIDGKKKRIWHGKKETLLLPPPRNEEDHGVYVKESFVPEAFVKETLVSETSVSEPPPANENEADKIEIELPVMKPLHSPLTLEYLDEANRESAK